MRDWEISKVLASTTGCAAFEGKVQPLSNKPLAGFRADGRYRPHLRRLELLRETSRLLQCLLVEHGDVTRGGWECAALDHVPRVFERTWGVKGRAAQIRGTLCETNSELRSAYEPNRARLRE